MEGETGPRSRWSPAALRRGLTSLLFDSPCLVCDGEDGPVCPSCREEIVEAGGPQCPGCALSVGPWADLRGGCSWCRSRRLGFDAAVALGPYQGPIRALCLGMKSSSGSILARWSIDMLLEARGDALLAERADVVVAVPLHWRRRLLRGYNQADALASLLARRLGIRSSSSLLRAKNTPKLADLSRVERAAMMKRAFRVPMRTRLEGKTVLLVDDILTTGATCGASARALKRAGASRVVAVVLGRAEENS